MNQKQRNDHSATKGDADMEEEIRFMNLREFSSEQMKIKGKIDTA